MEKTINFAVDSIKKIKFNSKDYDDAEFAIAKVGFLSTRPNSHKLDISEDVLKKCADSVLGKWMVAKIDKFTGDATTHTPEEVIVGQIPLNQEVEFVKDDDDYLRAYALAVISKVYAKDYCDIFENDNERAVSVEMKIETENGNDMNDTVLKFNIVGVTTLGKDVNPSCPESDVTFIRFSETEANTYFSKIHEHNLTPLQKFAEERKILMAKSLKIDKSKDSLSDKPWGEVDKIAMRDKIMEASNKKTLVKSVYMLVEDGWEDAPSEHLKYPVMELKGDTFVYNRDGLASALGYAKKEEETAVVSKIEKIYKKLGLETDGKEGESKMSEIEFAAVNISDMWGKLWDVLHEKYPGPEGWGSIYCIDDLFEENGQKFAIIRNAEDEMYRLDFSLTEEGLTVADEITKVEVVIVETDTVKKFAEPDDAEKYHKFEEKPVEDDTDDDDDDDDKDVEMSADEMKAEIARLQAEIEQRDNVIMEKDTELADLRAFKQTCMEAERGAKVDAVMSEVAKFMDKAQADECRKEGLSCEFAEVDAWANKVKASVFDKATKNAQNVEFTRISAPVSTANSGDVWDRL